MPAGMPPPQQRGGRKRRNFGEFLIENLLLFCACFAILSVFFIILFLAKDGVIAFLRIGTVEFLAGSNWNPTGEPPSYGMLPLIAGTVLVMAGAMIISIPLSIGSAIFISELATPRMKAILKPAIELLAGIPSVVYGFFGLVLLGDWLMQLFGLSSGSTWLAGSIVLGIMAIPTITSVSEDAISAVPKEYREGSLSLGATRWQTITGVVLPSAISGIIAAVILGMGRAIGETMAVLMVTGNAAIIPEPIYNVFSPVRTMTGTLGIEMGEVAIGSLHYHALFGIAIVLLAIALLVNLIAIAISRHYGIGRKAGRRGPFLQISERWRQALAWGGAAVFVLAIGTIHVLMTIAATAAVLALIAFGRLSPLSRQKAGFALVACAALIVLVMLGVIVFYIVSLGVPAISWEFLTAAPRDLGRAGGIFPAIVGTLYLIAGAMLIAAPVGIASAVYLTEYRREGHLIRLIRTGVDLLNGTPSIVFGLFGFAFLVLYLGLGISLLAGQVTLGLMILPTIIRTTEEALKSVPASLREGSYALGATRLETIWRVVLPPALPGILTGAVLSIGRAAGETAPILFTAAIFSTRFLPDSLLDPVMALPYHLYILTTTVPGATAQKYGSALVLLIVVIFFYSLAITIRTRYRRQVRW